MKKIILTIIAAVAFAAAGSAQNTIVKDFKPVCDSLDAMLKRNRDVKGGLQLQNVMKRKNNLDFYFTNSLGDYPWREGEPEWFRKELKKRFPEKYKNYGIGVIYSNKIAFERLTTPELGFDGTPSDTKGRIEKTALEYLAKAGYDVSELDEDKKGRKLLFKVGDDIEVVLAKAADVITNKVIKPFKPIISGAIGAINPAAGAIATKAMDTVERFSDEGFTPFKRLKQG